MHGNMNQVKTPARKQPIKRRHKPWKIVRKAQRKDKLYLQNQAIGYGRTA